MAPQITNDLQSVLQTRDPELVDVLIESDPGEGGQLEAALDQLGIDYTQVGARNRSVFEATINRSDLDTLSRSTLAATIDHNPTFSPLGTVANPELIGSEVAPDMTQATLFQVTEALGVESAWEAAGGRGDGARVGIIDTPIDPDHPSYGHAVSETANLGRADDHGSWVASAIAARETETDRGGRVRGVAPECDIYGYGALAGNGATAGEIIEGIDWLLERDVDIINLSLGGPHSEILWDSVRDARNGGALPVSSIGNAGPGKGTASCPAHHAEAIGVGSASFEGNAAAFSSRGPGWVDAPDKPDVMAYGGSAVVGENGLIITETVLGAGAGGSYNYLLGTSMAGPQVAGLAAVKVGGERQ